MAIASAVAVPAVYSGLGLGLNGYGGAIGYGAPISAIGYAAPRAAIGPNIMYGGYSLVSHSASGPGLRNQQNSTFISLFLYFFP